MRRGEIRMANLEPVLGAEADKRRPCVIVSNDGANRVAERLGRGVLTVVPLTTSTERVYPFQVLLPSRETGLPQDSKAQAEQVRSISVERIGEAVGTVPGGLLGSLDDALRLHLAL
jgi:mRNA interferase MazF